MQCASYKEWYLFLAFYVALQPVNDFLLGNKRKPRAHAFNVLCPNPRKFPKQAALCKTVCVYFQLLLLFGWLVLSTRVLYTIENRVHYVILVFFPLLSIPVCYSPIGNVIYSYIVQVEHRRVRNILVMGVFSVCKTSLPR